MVHIIRIIKYIYRISFTVSTRFLQRLCLWTFESQVLFISTYFHLWKKVLQIREAGCRGPADDMKGNSRRVNFVHIFIYLFYLCTEKSLILLKIPTFFNFDFVPPELLSFPHSLHANFFFFYSVMQYVPPDLCVCNFVLEQSLSVRALQEMLANTGQNSEGVSTFLLPTDVPLFSI